MKKTIFAIAVLACAYFASAQKAPTVAVKSAFEKKFPGATNVKWVKEGKNDCEAKFEMNGNKYSANFLSNGTWKETEETIPVSAVPQPVMSAFKSKHRKASINLAEKVEKPSGSPHYEIAYKEGGKSKEILFDATGKEVKKY